MDKLSTYIEAIIFAAKDSVSTADVKNALETSFETKVGKKEIDAAIASLIEKYNDPSFSFQINEVNNGFQFMTKPEYHDIIGTWLKNQSNKKLSTASLETLSIIAYKQPVTKSEIEAIRGVNADYTVQKLLEKELCEIIGRDEGPGRPLLYGTTDKFMNYFGLKDITDLPKLKEIENDEENSIGVPDDFHEMEVLHVNEEE